MVRWKPFSLTAFRMLRTLRELGLRPRTIIDGGANVGQFARAAAETFPSVRIIAFEPLPTVAEQLRTNLSDRDIEIHAVALGSMDGTVSFRRNAYSLASSVLSLRPDAAQSFPQLRERDAIDVPIVRLDRVLERDPLEPPVLLKLDLQGYELEALRGAEHTLSRIRYVLLETSFRALYEEEPVFDEVYSFLRPRFRLVCPISILPDQRGRITQMDALFEVEAS